MLFTAPEAETPLPAVHVKVTIGGTPVVLEASPTAMPCYAGMCETLSPPPGYVLSQMNGQHPLGGEATVRLDAPGIQGTVELSRPLYHHAEFAFDDVRMMSPGRHTLTATPAFEGPPVTGLGPVDTPIAVGLAARQVIPWRTQPVTVDGVLDRPEWSGPAQLFGLPQQDVLPGKWTGPADYRGEVRMRQDAENLYFAVEARDDALSFPATSDAELYNRDGIELFLGLDTADCRRTTYGAGDFQIIVSADDDGAGSLTARWYSPQAPATVNGNPSTVTAKRTATGYVIEGCLPWALLKPGFAPTKDTVIGLNVKAKDLDSPAPGEESAFNLTGLESASTDPSGWTAAGPGGPTPGFQLHWAQFPGLSGVDLPLHPHPIIEARYAGAGIATAYEGPVTLSLLNNVGHGWLGGTWTVFATQGRAEFPDVYIDRRGYYVLVATANGAGSEECPVFDVWEAYGLADVGVALEYAAGVKEGGIDWERLDVSRNGSIDVPDAALVARKVTGMDANP